MGDYFKDSTTPYSQTGGFWHVRKASVSFHVGDWKPSLFSAGKFSLHLWAEAYCCRTPLPTKPETITKIEAGGMFHPHSRSFLILLSLSYLSFFLLSFLFCLHFNSWMTFNIWQHRKTKITFQRFKWRNDLGSDGQHKSATRFPWDNYPLKNTHTYSGEFSL